MTAQPHVGQRLFGGLAGLHLPAGLSPSSYRLSSARGVLQLAASAITGTGVACLVSIATASAAAYGGLATWSWGLWSGCVALMLLIDAAYNVALNLTGGWRYVVLLVVRLALTAVLAQFTAQMVILQLNRDAVAPIAQRVAGKEFDRGMETLRSALGSAEKALTERRGELSSFDIAAAALPIAALPTGCADAPPAALSEDASTRRMQQRAERARQSQCAQLMSQQAAALQRQATGQADLRGRISTALASQQTNVESAKKTLDEAERGRTAAVIALSASVATQTAALGELMSTNSATTGLYWSLIMLITVIELLALGVKALTTNIDEAALLAQEDLLARCEIHLAGVQAAELVRGASRAAWRSPNLRTSARQHREAGVVGSMGVQEAVQQAKRAWQTVAAEMGAGASH